MKRSIVVLTALSVAVASATLYIAFPTGGGLDLVPPLAPLLSSEAPDTGAYSADYGPLSEAFAPQAYRSFCGPASLATILRAYGNDADQRGLFPSIRWKIDTFFSGMTLGELSELAGNLGLVSTAIYADSVSIDEFRDLVKSNLSESGNYLLVNYDRRRLQQQGAGHISALGAYDDERDAVLVLDQASYKYPFTWVPTPQLYDAIHTMDGQQYRGVLVVYDYEGPSVSRPRR